MKFIKFVISWMRYILDFNLISEYRKYGEYTYKKIELLNIRENDDIKLSKMFSHTKGYDFDNHLLKLQKINNINLENMFENYDSLEEFTDRYLEQILQYSNPLYHIENIDIKDNVDNMDISITIDTAIDTYVFLEILNNISYKLFNFTFDYTINASILYERISYDIIINSNINPSKDITLFLININRQIELNISNIFNTGNSKRKELFLEYINKFNSDNISNRLELLKSHNIEEITNLYNSNQSNIKTIQNFITNV